VVTLYMAFRSCLKLPLELTAVQHCCFQTIVEDISQNASVESMLEAFDSGCSGILVEYRTHNRQVADSTHTRSSASNFEQVANLLCAQAKSASYPCGTGNE